RHVVDRVLLSAPPRFEPRIDEDELRISKAASNLFHGNRVAGSLTRREDGRVDVLLAGREGTEPRLDPAGQNGAVVVPAVAQEPPEAPGAPHVSVGNHENAPAH